MPFKVSAFEDLSHKSLFLWIRYLMLLKLDNKIQFLKKKKLFLYSKWTMAALVQHVNTFQVLHVKLDTKLKSPDTSFTCITLECCSILLLAYYTVIYSWRAVNYVHIAKRKALFSSDWTYRFLTILFLFQRVLGIF